MSAPTPSATRGEPTREALIRAAIDVFGRDGFDAASTRAISDAAGVNQALIGYHFGGKPGLYLAALRFIAASVSTRIGPLVESIEAQLKADGAARARTGKKVAERARAALQSLLEAFVGMLASDDSAAWARLILREQQNPSDGFDVLYEGFMHRILDVASELVARAQNRGASAAQCKLTAFTILGQAIVFRAARAAVMREMQWQRLGAEELESIRAQLRRNVAAIVKAEPAR
jgi:AcrR family transcriptional regulator